MSAVILRWPAGAWQMAEWVTVWGRCWRAVPSAGTEARGVTDAVLGYTERDPLLGFRVLSPHPAG